MYSGESESLQPAITPNKAGQNTYHFVKTGNLGINIWPHMPLGINIWPHSQETQEYLTCMEHIE